jgi:hypothetical protein
MAYTMEEFFKLKLPCSERIADCVSCKKQIRNEDEYQRVPSGLIHDDCYYDDLSDILEKYPPGLIR